MKVMHDPSAINEGMRQNKVSKNNLDGVSIDGSTKGTSTVKAMLKVCKAAQSSSNYSYGQPTHQTTPEVAGKSPE
ncbi:MAG: hypothetical protein HN337_06360 [Deltaproteobacteria bacterium]|jgi:hypothetical protein|nr:hypothetical protein [Deltaproteobacteria bacterium]